MLFDGGIAGGFAAIRKVIGNVLPRIVTTPSSVSATSQLTQNATQKTILQGDMLTLRRNERQLQGFIDRDVIESAAGSPL